MVEKSDNIRKRVSYPDFFSFSALHGYCVPLVDWRSTGSWNSDGNPAIFLAKGPHKGAWVRCSASEESQEEKRQRKYSISVNKTTQHLLENTHAGVNHTCRS